MFQPNIILLETDFSPDILNKIAKLHEENIPIGFISSLGLVFIAKMYEGIGKAPNSCIIIARDEKNEISGFISGSVSTREMFKWILPRYGIRYFIILLFYILYPSTIKKIAETVSYLWKNRHHKATPSEQSDPINAELLSIAVSSNRRKRGTGKHLVTELEKFFRRNSCDQYKVVTDSNDTVSNKFYIANGFILKSSFLHHGRQMNEYLKKID